MKILFTFAAALLTAAIPCPAQDAADQFSKAAAAAAATGIPDDHQGVPGTDPEWLFFDKELIHLATGDFWTKDYADISVSKTDPIPVILDYQQQLDAMGIELLLVPVPPKASIYPEKFTAQGKPAAIAPFYEALSKAGVSVIDLEPVFATEREKNPSQLLYCKKDSHYSPYATQLIAKLIHEKYQGSDWAKTIASDTKFVADGEALITVTSDLVPGESEKLPGVQINDATDEQIRPSDPASPIILMGDSHTMVFSDGGDYHANGSGLPDHLQAAFGTPIHRFANPGSGSHSPRLALFQKARAIPGYWDNKKLFVWIFSAREFTQARRWSKIPVKK